MQRVKDLFDSAPPSSLEAERAVLGALLVSKDPKSVLDRISPVVSSHDFYGGENRIVFEHVVRLADSGKPIEAVLLGDSLSGATGHDVRALDAVGGEGYLVELAQAVANDSHALFHAELIHKSASKRRLLRVAEDAFQFAHNGRDPADAARALMDTLENSFHDSPLLGEELSRNELKPIVASDLGGSVSIDWLWEGWLAAGSVTLMVGMWKAGKTTLLAHVLRDSATGSFTMGQLSQFNVLYVTEESQGLWAARRDNLGIQDNVSFVNRPFKARPTYRIWESFVSGIAKLVAEHPFGVVIFDPWAAVSPCDDENDSASMQKALMPLHKITEAGAAVLIAHHPRKGGGTEGSASRGSGALPAFADIIVELRRFDAAKSDDTRRVLRGYSRYDTTPGELVIDLRHDGYHAVGSSSDVNRLDRSSTIRDILETSDGEMLAADVHDRWPEDGANTPSKRQIQRDLNDGFNKGLWSRSGMGVRGKPHLYSCQTGCHETITESTLSAGTETV